MSRSDEYKLLGISSVVWALRLLLRLPSVILKSILETFKSYYVLSCTTIILYPSNLLHVHKSYSTPIMESL